MGIVNNGILLVDFFIPFIIYVFARMQILDTLFAVDSLFSVVYHGLVIQAHKIFSTYEVEFKLWILYTDIT